MTQNCELSLVPGPYKTCPGTMNGVYRTPISPLIHTTLCVSAYVPRLRESMRMYWAVP